MRMAPKLSNNTLKIMLLGLLRGRLEVNWPY